jgi:hypothetical protein
MRLDEYQIANALIDTRLVMTSRHGARIWGKGSNGMKYPSPFIDPSLSEKPTYAPWLCVAQLPSSSSLINWHQRLCRLFPSGCPFR